MKTILYTEKDFTYGMEVEGRIKESAVRTLMNDYSRKIDCKSDGSVSVAHKSGFSDYTEFAMGVFKEFKEIVDILSFLENDGNYLSNKTCGLHLHIYPLKEEMRQVIGDKKLIFTMQEWAKTNLCEHTADRVISDNRYCKTYKEKDELRLLWLQKSKYQFVRNHPDNTYEFRFLSACEHKKDNVERFFKMFLEELNKTRPKVELDLTLKNTRTKNLKINLGEIDTEEQSLSFNF